MGIILILLRGRKPLKIYLNVNATGQLFLDYDFSVSSIDDDGNFFDIEFGKQNGKRQYDGTINFILDVSNLNCNHFIEIIRWTNEMNFNNVTIEYSQNFVLFDYISYKSKIKNIIN